MIAALGLALALALGPSAAPGTVLHPLHTTLAEVTVDRGHGSVRVVVRVFADDFGAAVTAARGAGPWGARAAAYVSRAITLVDAGRQRVDLHDCGTRRQGDLLWLCSEASVPTARLRGLALVDQMLCDLFADQVNVVRVVDGPTTRSALFTRGDGGKRILD